MEPTRMTASPLPTTAEPVAHRLPASGAPRPSLRSSWWSVALALSGWAAVAVVALGAPVALRVVVVFGFVMLGPGLSVVSLLDRGSLLERLLVSIALSVALAALVAEAMAISGAWSPTLALAGLAALCTVGVSLGVFRDRGRRLMVVSARDPQP